MYNSVIIVCVYSLFNNIFITKNKRMVNNKTSRTKKYRFHFIFRNQKEYLNFRKESNREKLFRQKKRYPFIIKQY